MKKFFIFLLLFVCLFFEKLSIFAADNHTEKTEKFYVISAKVIDLPWLHGNGRIDDLQVSATNNEKLRLFIEKLALCDSANEIYHNFDNLLSMWTQAENSDLPMQKYVLAKFMQTSPVEIEKYKPRNIQNAYILLKDMMYVYFIAQTDFFQKFDIKYDYAENKIITGESIYEKIILNMLDNDSYIASYVILKMLAREKLLDSEKLGKAINKFGYGAHILTYSNSNSHFQYFKQAFTDNTMPLSLFGSKEADTIKGANTPDIIYSNEGNDIIYGGPGDDFLHGGSGDDKIYGEDGNDILIGAEGNNILNGGGGSDIYIYNGLGNDIIIDEKWGKLKKQRWYWDNTISDYKYVWDDEGEILVEGGNDSVVFGNNLLKSDFDIKRDGNNLVFILKNNKHALTVKNWYASKEQKIEKFYFSDGTILNPQHLAGIHL